MADTPDELRILGIYEEPTEILMSGRFFAEDVWRDCAEGHIYINWRLRDGDECPLCEALNG